MNPVLSEFQQIVVKMILHLREDLKSIRTGRASPSLVENLIVETYGGQTKLKLLELAHLTTEGPAQIVVTPFDPSTTSDIEKSILKSPIGFSPQVQGVRIIIKIPPLSEEQRQKLGKIVAQKIEEKKMAIRNVRDDARRKIKISFEKKEITEDEKFRQEKEIDTETQKYMDEIMSIKDLKEKEIMEV